MRMAKASQEEIESALDLTNLLENACPTRNYERPMIGEDYIDTDCLEDLQRFYNEVKRLSPGLMRVTFGYSVLLSNCCDPNEDCLEWKPEIKRLMEQDSKAS